jgi:hypothetical protein
MHGNSYIMLLYKISDFSELPPEMSGPIEGANGVRGERNQVRAYSKKVETILNIVLHNLKEAV